MNDFDHSANGYLVRPFDIREVLLRIRVFLSHSQPEEENIMSNVILQAGVIETLPDTLEVVVLNKQMKLTQT